MEIWNWLRSMVGLHRNHNGDGDGDGKVKSDSSESVAEPRIGAEEGESRERKRAVEHPPDDDCCPICFGEFSAACRGPCGHWYCGDCILQYWNHGAALQPCKCPMCSQKITRLMPESTLDQHQHFDILRNVGKYNRLFVGGTNGFILKVLESPLLIKRIFCEMMNPDAADNNLLKARLFATLLGALCTMSPLDFALPGRLHIVDFLDDLAIALVFILYLIGLYRRRQQRQRVRQLFLLHHNMLHPLTLLYLDLSRVKSKLRIRYASQR